mgnify:CR=1 FL=1
MVMSSGNEGRYVVFQVIVDDVTRYGTCVPKEYVGEYLNNMDGAEVDMIDETDNICDCPNYYDHETKTEVPTGCYNEEEEMWGENGELDYEEEE